MLPILIITHLEDRQDGLARECLEQAGCPVVSANPADGLTFPAIDEIAGVIALGGNQSATRVADDAFLTTEVKLLSAALEQSRPVLGMCLGAQLLAVAAGGHVSPMGYIYAGWPELASLSTLAADPLFGTLPAGLPVLEWHEDKIALPADAVALGDGRGPGAGLFRIGAAAWGSQAHLEATPRMVLDGWLADDEGIAQIKTAGLEIERFRAESQERLPVQMAAARPTFAAFAEFARL